MSNDRWTNDSWIAYLERAIERKQAKVIVKWDDGSDHQQTCATEYVARECMKALRADAAIKRAMAYYTDDRGAFDTYERRA